MKLALCLEYGIEQFGGTEVLVRELLRRLSTKHEIVLVSDDSPETLRDAPSSSYVSKHIPWRAERATRAQMRDLSERIHAAGVDLAHFHFGGTFAWGSRLLNTSPVLHVARRGVPTLITNHGVFSLFDGYIGAQRSLLTKLTLLPFAWAARVQLVSSVFAEVAVSQNDYRWLRHRYWPVRHKFRQIYHSQLKEPAPPLSTGRTPSIVCIGTIGPRKGQTFLVEAFCRIAQRFPDWKLILIGRGGEPEMVARIQQLTVEHNLSDRILMLGNQSDEEVARWYQRAGIFAMPSVAEGLGLSLQEALYYGCTCVASRAGGIQDLIQHDDNGLLVEPANVSELVTSLERLMADTALRRRLAARARDSILEKGMTAPRMVENYEKLYAQCLAQARTKAKA
jgi:glycosyltransferase involved in cell wall biosynthesis